MNSPNLPTLKIAPSGYDIISPEGIKLGKIKPRKVDYQGRKQVRWFYKDWGHGHSTPTEALKEFNQCS